MKYDRETLIDDVIGDMSCPRMYGLDDHKDCNKGISCDICKAEALNKALKEADAE